MLGETIFDLVMPWNGLGHFCYRILIPVVALTMSDKNASHVGDSFDEFRALHPTISSPTWCTWDMLPLVNS